MEILFLFYILHLSTSLIQFSALAAAGHFLMNKSNEQAKKNRKIALGFLHMPAGLSVIFYLSLMI